MTGGLCDEPASSADLMHSGTTAFTPSRHVGPTPPSIPVWRATKLGVICHDTAEVACNSSLKRRDGTAVAVRRRSGSLRRRNARRHTADAALATDCEILRAGAASRSHHAWSPDLRAMKGVVPFPFQPNVAGQRAIADLVLAQVCRAAPSWSAKPAGVRRQGERDDVATT
jgi:hypothetical protein